MTVSLSQQLTAVEDRLAAERKKIANEAKRSAYIARERAAGRLSVADLMALPDVDGGSADKVADLEGQAAMLRRQIARASEVAALPQQRPADPVEAAVSRAHAAFVETTRELLVRAEAGRPLPASRPFAGSVSRGAAAECSGPDCEVCTEYRELEAARAAGEEPVYAPDGDELVVYR
jgi:hypothetical protein